MSSSRSLLARNGSHLSTISTTSAAASTVSTLNTSSSHNHVLSALRPLHKLPSWLHICWSPINHRHERIAVGAPSMGIAVLTLEMMEMHIQQAPDVRGMLDCLPVARVSNGGSAGWTGWRRKLGTWPL